MGLTEKELELPAPQRLVLAAVDQLAEGRELLDLGLNRGRLAQAAYLASGTVNNHFGSKQTFALQHRLMKWLDDEIRAEVKANAADYANVAELVREGASGPLFRRRLAKALLGDIADYDPGAEDDWRRSGRERLFYLAVALCGVVNKEAGLDYSQILRQTWQATQEGYEAIYDDFCDVTGRTYIAGRERTQLAINAYLEGLSLQRRLGVVTSDEEIVDTVVRLFHTTTRPLDGPELDVDAELFGGDPASAPTGADDAYQRAIALLERAAASNRPGTLLHASIHGPASAEEPTADDVVVRLRAQMLRMVAAGWQLRRLVAVHSTPHLDNQLDVGREFTEAARADRRNGGILIRAFVHDGMPQLAPIVVRGEAALLGVDGRFSNRVETLLAVTERSAVDALEAHFDALWHEPRTEAIWTERGADQRGIAALREALTT